jgi:hypothetical protein
VVVRSVGATCCACCRDFKRCRAQYSRRILR